jgi:hypothetical protein
MYLNSDWEEADGGALRLALPDGSGDLDILPTAGRLVLLQVALDSQSPASYPTCIHSTTALSPVH